MEPSPPLRRSNSSSRRSSKSSEVLVPATQPDPTPVRKASSSQKLRNSDPKRTSLSYADDSEDFSYRQSIEPTQLDQPSIEMPPPPALTPIKTRPNRTLKRKVSDITLGDLLKDRCLKTGERLKFNGEEGIITKDAWIEYGAEKYPTLEEFASAVSASTKCAIPENAWKEVIARAVPIVFIAENYLATLPTHAPSATETPKKKKTKQKDKSLSSDSKAKKEKSPPSESKKQKEKERKKEKKEKKPPRTESPNKGAEEEEKESEEEREKAAEVHVNEKEEEEETERSETAAAVSAPQRTPSKKRKSSLSDVRPQDLHKNASADLLDFVGGSVSNHQVRSRSSTQQSSSLSSAASLPFGVSASQPELRTSARRRSVESPQLKHKVVDEDDEEGVEEVFLSVSPSPLLESPDKPPAASKSALNKSPALLKKQKTVQKEKEKAKEKKSDAQKSAAASAATASPASEDTLASHERNLAAMDSLIRNRVSPPSVLSKPSEEMTVEPVAKRSSSKHKVSLPPQKDAASCEGDAFFTPSNEISAVEEVVLLGTGLKSDMLLQMQTLVTKLRFTGMVQSYGPNVSHLVATVNQERRTQRTVKYLSAVLEGKWIVSFNWVVACLAAGKRVDEREYEVLGDTHATGAPALSRIAHTKKNFSALFSRHRFYFDGVFESPSKAELESLVRLGGATILSEPPSSASLSSSSSLAANDLVLCDPAKCSDEQLRSVHLNTARHAVSVVWILDSISQYALQPLKEYRLVPQDLQAMLQTQASQTY